MELLSFLILFSTACLLSLLRVKLHPIHMALLMIHFSIVRYSGFDADIEVYVDAFEADLVGFYYLREPFFWFGGRFVFSLLQSPELTFLVFDCLTILILFFAFNRLDLRAGHFLGFFVLSPIILGYENTYRQYLSEIFSIYLLSVFLSKNGSFHFLSSFLMGASHNVGFAFLPAFFSFSKYQILRLGVLIIVPLYPILLRTASGTKSLEARSGADLATIYIVALTGIFIGITLLHNHKNAFFLRAILASSVALILSISGSIILDSGISERFTTFALIINIVIFWWICERRLQNLKSLPVLLSVVFGFLPIFFVEAVYMLNTSSV